MLRGLMLRLGEHIDFEDDPDKFTTMESVLG